MFPPDLLANSPGVDAQLFWGSAAVPGQFTWQTWHKPVGRSFLYMIVISPGGGGGGGGTSGTVGGGGGGGGATFTLQIPLIFVPDILYLDIGQGGIGGAAASNAGNTGAVDISNNYTASRSGAMITLAGGGAGQTAGTGGAARAARR